MFEFDIDAAVYALITVVYVALLFAVIPFLLINRNKLISSYCIGMVWAFMTTYVAFFVFGIFFGEEISFGRNLRLTVVVMVVIGIVYILLFYLYLGIIWLQRDSDFRRWFDPVDVYFARHLWFLDRSKWERKRDK